MVKQGIFEKTGIKHSTNYFAKYSSIVKSQKFIFNILYNYFRVFYLKNLLYKRNGELRNTTGYEKYFYEKVSLVLAVFCLFIGFFVFLLFYDLSMFQKNDKLIINL